MKYIFNNILLADSNINEPASHGFVRYRIKPLPSLAAGDSIKNNGGIFFDTNSPVATNTAITVIVLPTGIENLSSTVDFFVFPNPATDMISIKSNVHENKPVCIKLLNILGEILITENQNSFSEIDLSLRSLSGGVYMLMIETENKIFNHKILKM